MYQNAPHVHDRNILDVGKLRKDIVSSQHVVNHKGPVATESGSSPEEHIIWFVSDT